MIHRIVVLRLDPKLFKKLSLEKEREGLNWENYIKYLFERRFENE